jgi:hypothetical protein
VVIELLKVKIPPEQREQYIIIRWATRELWKAIPQAQLDAIAQNFDSTMGKSYPIVESLEFQVRKFPHS